MKKVLTVMLVLAAVAGFGMAAEALDVSIGARHAGLGNISGVGSMNGMWQIEVLVGPLCITPGWLTDNEGRVMMTPFTFGFIAKAPLPFISPYIGLDLTYYAETSSKDELFNKVLPKIIGCSTDLMAEIQKYGFGDGYTTLWGIEAKAGVEFGLDKAVRIYTGIGFGYTMISANFGSGNVTFGIGSVTWETWFRLYLIGRPKDEHGNNPAVPGVKK